MPEGVALINLGELSKPATVLIEKVSDAVGVLFEPKRITRKARAEVEAEKIKAVARIELNEIELRAVERFFFQEARKQQNIEQITAAAATALPASAQSDKLEEDWLAHFFKQCESVSDHEMQSLWARLLAGEATNPGTVSKRTVDFISSVSKKDASLFTAFCQFVWVIGNPVPLLLDFKNPMYVEKGITFESLQHLDAIGLISFNSLTGYSKQGFTKYCHVFYYGRPMLIEFPNDEANVLSIGHTLLTAIGNELLPICGSVRNQEFYDYVTNSWFTQGLIISSVASQR